MSKSKGNIVVPWEVIDRFGADAFRWYFFTSKQPWDGYRFSIEAVGEGVRLFLRQLWNTYALPAHLRARASRASETELDRWVRSRLSATVAEVTERLEAFDATTAGRAIAAFVDDLSNWYVRRSRRRFWEGDGAAFATLRECLLTVAQLLAPFTPFIADEIYEKLDGGEPSVHLTDWPRARRRATSRSRRRWPTARETVRLGLAARGQAKVKVRQPLHEAVGRRRGRRARGDRAPGRRRPRRAQRQARCGSSTRPTSWAPTRSSRTTARSGPRFGKAMPQVAAAVAALDPAHVAARLRDGGHGRRRVDGHDHRARPRGPAARDAAAGRLPARARGLARGRARARARRGAACARGSRARSSTRSRARARRPAWPSRTGSSWRSAATTSCSPPRASTRPTLAGEVLATTRPYRPARGEGDAATIEGRELRIAVERA